jgi:acyl-CoA synthetase (NDP forming)
VQVLTDSARDGVTELRRHAFRLAGSANWSVPEPFVKQLLAASGVCVPPGALVEKGTLPSVAAQSLREPFVLKAWGPGIVHKSELGAVRVGLTRRTLDGDAAAMLQTVSGHGVRGAQLYVEEMAPAGGTEILVGMIARPPFGTLAILGTGGTRTELFDDVSVKLCPVSLAAAREMVDGFRGAPLLKGYRGTPPADREALVAVIMALAGKDGLADRLGAAFVEFECNPLFVSASGVIAADARLILRDPDTVSANRHRPFEPAALFAPKSVAVVGASASRRTAWGNRTLARYRDLGWTDNLYAVHPSESMIDGVPAFRSLADIPGGVDYAEISVAASLAPGVLREAKGTVKTATINSAGFSETGSPGKSLEAELIEAALQGAVRFVGPNCMGVYSPGGRQAFSGAISRIAGHVGAVMQSGGLSTDLIQIGARRGLRFSNVVSAGNAVDISLGELVQFLVDDPDTRTIAVYVEGGTDTKLTQALRDARGHKPVVLLVPGLSTTGARVAASHTGSLTSERRSWEALAAATGAVLTESFEHFLASLIYLDRYGADEVADNDSVLIMGLGGGASVLAADACDAHGIAVPLLNADLQSKLADKKGGILINPLDLRMGPAGPPTGPSEVLDLILPVQPFSDVLLHVDMMTYCNSTVPGRMPGLGHLIEMVRSLVAGNRRTRLALVTRNLTAAPGRYHDELNELMLESRLPMFENFDAAAAAIAAAKRFTHHELQARAVGQ